MHNHLIYNNAVNTLHVVQGQERDRLMADHPYPALEPTSTPRSFRSLQSLMDGGPTQEEVPEAVARNKAKMDGYHKASTVANEASEALVKEHWTELERVHEWVFRTLADSHRMNVRGEVSVVTVKDLEL